MRQSNELIQLLKRRLRQARITYAAIAEHLGMSEANVKRLFASESFALQRIEAICELIPLSLSDLFAELEQSRARITHLTQQQEQELVSDPQLLLVAVSVRNHLDFDAIVERYQISDSDCIRCLAKLDRLKIIDLLPGNRLRLLIDDNFNWLPNGPIERLYQEQIEQPFLRSRFAGDLECRLFRFALLSEASAHEMLKKLQQLGREFSELHQHDCQLPLDSRNNMGLLLALRPWEFDFFGPLLNQRERSNSPYRTIPTNQKPRSRPDNPNKKR